MSKQSNLINASQDITVDSSGNVGIGGVSSPEEKLHVKGSLKVDFGSAGGNPRVYLDHDTATDDGNYLQLNRGDDGLEVVGQDNVKIRTNGSERMRIDPAGRVTMPYQPLANVNIHDHNTSVVHAGAGVSALNTSTAMSQGGMSVTSDRITVPVAGKYYVSARQLNLSDSGEYFNISLNGMSIGYGYNSDTTELHDLNVDQIVSMSANDYIQVYYNSATGNRWEGAHSNLLIYLIG